MHLAKDIRITPSTSLPLSAAAMTRKKNNNKNNATTAVVAAAAKEPSTKAKKEVVEVKIDGIQYDQRGPNKEGVITLSCIMYKSKVGSSEDSGGGRSHGSGYPLRTSIKLGRMEVIVSARVNSHSSKGSKILTS